MEFGLKTVPGIKRTCAMTPDLVALTTSAARSVDVVALSLLVTATPDIVVADARPIIIVIIIIISSSRSSRSIVTSGALTIIAVVDSFIDAALGSSRGVLRSW